MSKSILYEPTTYYFSQATKMFMFDALCARIFWYASWYTETIKVTWNIWHSCFSVKCKSGKKKRVYFEVNFRNYKIYFWKFCLSDICHTHKVYFLHPSKFDTQQIKPFGNCCVRSNKFANKSLISQLQNSA